MCSPYTSPPSHGILARRVGLPQRLQALTYRPVGRIAGRGVLSEDLVDLDRWDKAKDIWDAESEADA